VGKEREKYEIIGINAWEGPMGAGNGRDWARGRRNERAVNEWEGMK